MYGTTTTATAAPASSGRAAEQPKTALIYGQMNELHPRSRGTTEAQADREHRAVVRFIRARAEQPFFSKEKNL